jgi:hypothetical protein
VQSLPIWSLWELTGCPGLDSWTATFQSGELTLSCSPYLHLLLFCSSITKYKVFRSFKPWVYVAWPLMFLRLFIDFYTELCWNIYATRIHGWYVGLKKEIFLFLSSKFIFFKFSWINWLRLSGAKNGMKTKLFVFETYRAVYACLLLIINRNRNKFHDFFSHIDKL